MNEKVWFCCNLCEGIWHIKRKSVPDRNTLGGIESLMENGDHQESQSHSESEFHPFDQADDAVSG